MAYQMVATAVTLYDLEGHSPLAVGEQTNDAQTQVRIDGRRTRKNNPLGTYRWGRHENNIDASLQYSTRSTMSSRAAPSSAVATAAPPCET